MLEQEPIGQPDNPVTPQEEARILEEIDKTNTASVSDAAVRVVGAARALKWLDWRNSKTPPAETGTNMIGQASQLDKIADDKAA